MTLKDAPLKPASKAIKPNKKSLRRDMFREAALKLFSQNGYERTSLQDIAEVLGITHPALYYYYKNKADLLYDAIHTSISQLLEALQKAAKQENSSPKNELKKIIESQIEFQFKSQNSVRLIDSVLFGAMSKADILSNRQSEEILKQQKQIVELYRDCVKRGIESGEFFDQDIRIAVFAILGIVSNVPYWFRADGQLSIEEAIDKVGQFIFNSLIKRA